MYKLIFYLITFLNLSFEGIIQNAGGDNWQSAGVELIIKIGLAIFIRNYLKKIE